ncbi:DUF6886 family protein [Paraburkholderia bryophila]|uniref:DUF6886 family protein n=1 Tax=Paraburkholderia bryophila TaxID=420952 RepID=UPI0038BB2194
MGEVGMWVSQTSVEPVDLLTMRDLLNELESHGVELRVMERLTPLKGIWSSSLHASGIRLRNAQDWGKPGWTHSKPGRSTLIERKWSTSYACAGCLDC